MVTKENEIEDKAADAKISPSAETSKAVKSVKRQVSLKELIKERRVKYKEVSIEYEGVDYTFNAKPLSALASTKLINFEKQMLDGGISYTGEGIEFIITNSCAIGEIPLTANDLDALPSPLMIALASEALKISGPGGDDEDF